LVFLTRCVWVWMSTAWFIVRQSRLVTCRQIGDVLLWTKILDCRLILRPWFHLLYHFLSIHPKSMITYGCFWCLLVWATCGDGSDGMLRIQEHRLRKHVGRGGGGLQVVGRF